MSTYKEVKKIGTRRVLELLRLHPDWSVDKIAKVVANEGTPVYRSDVARMRAEMKQAADSVRAAPLKAPLSLIADKRQEFQKERREAAQAHADATGVTMTRVAEDADGVRQPVAFKHEQMNAGKLAALDAVTNDPEAFARAIADAAPQLMAPPSSAPAALAALDAPGAFVPPSKEWPKLHAEAFTKPGAHKGARNVEAMKIRRDWLNEFLDQNPGAFPQEILGIMKTLFGMTTSPNYVYESCRIARELHNLPPIPRIDRGPHHKEEEPMPSVSVPVPAAPDADDGLRVVVWMQPNATPGGSHQKFELTTKEKLGNRVFELVVSGVKQDSIRVFRPATFKLSFSVEIG